MKLFLACIILFLSAMRVTAQQTSPVMKIATDKEVYLKGDSIKWQCELIGFGRSFNAVTLQIWIENIDNGMRWQYRFPVINNYAEGAMGIDTSLPPGKYAFNFLLQHNFFNLKGHLSMPHAADTVLNYLAIFKTKESMLNTVKVSRTGDFSLQGIVFQDTAMISFSRTDKKDDIPFITVETSLDSTVRPAIPVITKFIHVIDIKGNADTGKVSSSSLQKDYQFELNPNAKQLDNVTIKDTRINKSLKEYQATYVTPGFASIDAITLDGLSNNDMQKASDVFLYLTMHVPGLTTSIDETTGLTAIKWRNSTPAIYLDEFRLPEGTPLTIIPGDIAMIKVFRPGSGPLTGANNNNGAIAIYTKMGKFSGPDVDAQHHNRFYVRGYDGLSLLWSY